MKQVEPKGISRRRLLAMAGASAGATLLAPTITLEGDANGAPHPEETSYRQKFSGKYAYPLIKGGIGHNLPQEAPQAFAQAVIDADAL